MMGKIMDENTIDLKQLLFLIKETKQSTANLILDEGCTITCTDQKPLVKMINYVMNYLERLTDRPLEISLDLMPEAYALNFLAYSTQDEFQALSTHVEETLSDFQATLQLIHEKGRYLQIRFLFKRETS